MKFNPHVSLLSSAPSQPARAVWIEITIKSCRRMSTTSQPARAVWIEISGALHSILEISSHSLRGLCGLKLCLGKPLYRGIVASQPARAVWIEIYFDFLFGVKWFLSQPARAVWIEITVCIPAVTKSASHSLRGLCGLKLL